jgi:hypothetical protein
MGKDKAPRAFAPVHDLGDDGFEIMSIGAQAMQPNHGGVGLCCGFYFNSF